MKKKKIIIGAGALVCGLIIAIVLLTTSNDEQPSDGSQELVSTEAAISSYAESIEEAQYTNLIFHDFEASIDDVKDVHNIKIMANGDYLDRTFLENFSIMKDVIDDFFMEDFDKSYIEATFFMSEGDDIRVPYDDIEKQCIGKTYDEANLAVLFGNNTSEGGYMVQLDEGHSIAWFSRNGFGTIQPSMKEYKEIYRYISCKRQIDDVDINLKDGSIKLSELEEKVLSYLNDSFPLEVAENVTFGIGDVRVIDLGEYEGVCFKARRIYKGIPFEYGSNVSSDMYIDEYDSDGGEIGYVESTRPDTMLTFGHPSGTVVETDTITEMIPVDKAFERLSEKIGDNSVYDVYGVELVYRECVKADDIEEEGVEAVLRPMWKITTINQNDDKYTIFYVDVVTGDITERFEYYYE